MKSSLVSRFGWLVGVLCAVSAASAAAESSWEKMARELLTELVAIDTTQTGDNTAAARLLQDRLLAAGLPLEDVHVIEAAPRKGNLVARLRSAAPKHKPVLLLAHMDVVPADAADWSVPPFELTAGTGSGTGVAWRMTRMRSRSTP